MNDDQFSRQPHRPEWAQGDDGTNLQAPDVGFGFDATPHELAAMLYTRQMVTGGYRFHRSLSWPTAAGLDVAGTLEGVTYHARFPSNVEVLCEPTPAAFSRVSIGNGRATVWIAASTEAELDAYLDELREALPPSERNPQAPSVDVTFWSLGQHGPSSRTRTIDVPPWESIADHYVEVARRQMDGLLAPEFVPGLGGQLFMWDGPPGTGKTFALRALAWEWREWCDLHYITDPETFFGERASYMLDVLLSDDGDDSAPAIGDGEDDEAPEPDPRAANGRWRLLVLEDTGELMSKDARERSGQGLSRLLNVVDGLIGQGLRVLVLVTTNEDLRRLHDAVSRPGRCAARVQFPAFPLAEARDWLTERDAPSEDVTGSMTLAELWARVEGRRLEAEASSGVGFV